jgi:hypothetical protein
VPDPTGRPVGREGAGNDSETGYVIVTREANGWRAEFSDLDTVRRARTLYALDRRVREVLRSEWVDYQFHTGDPTLDRLITGVRTARRTVQAAEDRARELTDRVLEISAGLSGRDLGVMLDLSHQRIHQLLQRATQSG